MTRAIKGKKESLSAKGAIVLGRPLCIANEPFVRMHLAIVPSK